MNLYKIKYDANRPSVKQIVVPADSNLAIGIKVEKNGTDVELDPSYVTLKYDDTVLSSTESYNGYVKFNIQTGSCAEDKIYDVNIQSEDATLKTSFKLIEQIRCGNIAEGISEGGSGEETDPIFTDWKNKLADSPKIFDITRNGMRVDISTAKCGDIIVDRSGEGNECIGFTYNGGDYTAP